MADGRIVWDRWSTRAFFNDDGTIREYQSVGRDITDLIEREQELVRKNEDLHAAYEQMAASEEEIRSQMDENRILLHKLAQSEERYRAIFEHTEAPTVIIEKDTRISLANSAFAEISGYSQEEVIGKSWTEFVSQTDLKRMISLHQQRREQGQDPDTRYEFTFINRHRCYCWDDPRYRGVCCVVS